MFLGEGNRVIAFFWIIAKCEKNGFFFHFILKSDLIRTESKPQNIVAVPVRRLPWLFRVLVAVLFKTYLIKSCLEGVSLNGNLILFSDKSWSRWLKYCEFRHSLSWVGRQSSKPLCSHAWMDCGTQVNNRDAHCAWAVLQQLLSTVRLIKNAVKWEVSLVSGRNFLFKEKAWVWHFSFVCCRQFLEVWRHGWRHVRFRFCVVLFLGWRDCRHLSLVCGHF